MHQSTVRSVNTYFGVWRSNCIYCSYTPGISLLLSFPRARTPEPVGNSPENETQTRVFGKQRHKHKEQNGSIVQREKKKNGSIGRSRATTAVSFDLTYVNRRTHLPLFASNTSDDIFAYEFICEALPKRQFTVWLN